MDGGGEEDELTFRIVLVTKPCNFIEAYRTRFPFPLKSRILSKGGEQRVWAFKIFV